MPGPLLAIGAGLARNVGKKLLGKINRKGVQQAIGAVRAGVGKIRGAVNRLPPSIKTGGRVAAGGAVFEVGSRAAGRVVGRKGPGSGPPAGDGTWGAGPGRAYRRMNAGNAKALRRAFRRVDAFGKLAKKYWKFAKPARSGPRLKKTSR